MKVAGIQMDVVYGNPDENYRRAEELIRAAVKDKPETVVLPETWNTGFPLRKGPKSWPTETVIGLRNFLQA